MPETNVFEAGSINVFMPHGDPYGLRVVTMDAWNGVVYVTPVEKLSEVFERLGNRAGVYALVDRSKDERVYIGKAIDLKRRVDNHEKLQSVNDFNPGLVLVITTSSETDRFEETEISYLEKLMIEVAKQSRAICININTPNANPTERTVAKVRGYLKRVQVLIPILGFEFATAVSALQPEVAPKRAAPLAGHSLPKEGLFVATWRRTGEVAEAVYDGKVVTVMKGALIRREELSSCPNSVRSLRRVLINRNGLTEYNDTLYLLNEDVQTHSFSEAAGLVTGSSINSLDYWRDKITGKSANEMLAK